MTPSSIVLVDIGNTSTLVARERAGRFTLVRRMASRGQTSRKVRLFLSLYARRGGLAGAMLCSVVPALDRLWINELQRIVRGKVLRVNHRLKLGIKIKYPRPAQIGADRLANAVAACEKYGAPVVVADFGTALTLDFVTADRAYAGGIIAPGPALLAESLAEKTALLPRLSAARIARIFQRKRAQLVGKSTAAAMLIGIRLGYLGLTKEIFARIRRDPRLRGAKLCATGGYAELVLKAAGLKINIDPLLTLRGLSRIYQRNRSFR